MTREELVIEMINLTTQDQLALLKGWMAHYSNDQSFLKNIMLEAQNGYTTQGYTQKKENHLEDWMEKGYLKDWDIPPKEMAERCIAYFKLEHDMLGHYIFLAQKVKDRIQGRERKQRQRLREKGLCPPASHVGTPHGSGDAAGEEDHVSKVSSKRSSSDLFDILSIHGITEPDLCRPLEEIIELIARYDGCPSIAAENRKADAETSHMLHDTMRDRWVIRELEKISVLDHTFNVVSHAIDLTTNEYRDAAVPLAAIVTAAMGHDVGRIPVLRQGGFSGSKDHARISADKMIRVLEGCAAPWAKVVIHAIADHHGNSSEETIGKILRTADIRARQEELCGACDMKVQSWETWFSAPDLVEIIKPNINVIKHSKLKTVFTLDNNVYCPPDALMRAAKDLAVGKNVIDFRFYREADRNTILCEIVDSLAKAGYLTDPIDPGFYGRTYRIQCWGNRFFSKAYLVAIPSKYFGDVSSSEMIKSGWVAKIRRVEPMLLTKRADIMKI